MPTAAVLARAGHKVIGVDVNPDVVSSLRGGRVHIAEPDLDEAVSYAVSSGLLTFQSVPSVADVYLIAVPTPFIITDDEIPKPNLDYVFSAARSIAPLIKPGNLVLLESTSPVGTTELFSRILFEVSGFDSSSIHIAYCPERVLPGKILHELTRNDRVIGGVTSESALVAKSFYSSFCTGALLKTTAATAELVKLTENSYRDTNIAFANELSLVCDRFGINVRELIRLANHHPRVNILQPGCGVGGHCIAVDPWFIADAAPDCTQLIQAARRVNDGKTDWVLSKVIDYANSLRLHLGRPVRIVCMGLAFKPDVDDLRESPALKVASELLLAGLDVYACEPNIIDHPVIRVTSLENALQLGDLFVFLVSHSNFKSLSLPHRHVLDFCGVTDSE